MRSLAIIRSGVRSAAVVLLASCLAGSALCAQWGTPEIIDRSDGDYFASVAVDGNGDVHTAYLLVPGILPARIVYASKSLGRWQSETIAELAALGGTRPDIAVTSRCEPVIVYSATDADPPVLVSRSGPGWQQEECPAEPVPHTAPVLFVDSDDRYHLAFAYMDGSIQYLCNDNGDWSSKLLSAEAASVTGIVADSRGVPYIVYLDESGSLFCATVKGGEWSTEKVVSPTFGAIGLWDSLAIDDLDRLHLVYLEGAPPVSSRLYYARYSGSSWEAEPVEDGGLWAQIGIGASYNARIAHVQSFAQGDKTRLVYQDKLGWHSESVPLLRSADWSLSSRMTAMAADERYVHLVYAGSGTASKGGNVLLYIRGEQASSVATPSAELVLNDDSFTIFETIVISAHVVNGPEAASVEAKVWVEDSDQWRQSILDPCSIFTLGPDTDTNVSVFEYTFTGREAPGNYTICARLIDPVTGEELSFDSVSFSFSGF